MTLTFVLPICNGLIDASERLEATAQRVLRGQQQSDSRVTCNGSSQLQHVTEQPTGAGSVVNGNLMAAPSACLVRWRWRLASTWRRVVKREQQWLQPLVRMLLVQPGLRAVKQGLLVDLPNAVRSKQGRTVKPVQFLLMCASCQRAQLLTLSGLPAQSVTSRHRPMHKHPECTQAFANPN